LIYKPLATVTTVWLTALFGWAGNEVANSMGAQSVVQQTQSASQALLIDAQQPTILEQNFKFNEQGPRVRQLQKAIGTVKVDGLYGSVTRREHIEALEARGLSTNNVPELSSAAKYNISQNPEHRCPEFEPLFAKHGLPVEVFSYIAYRESRCNPKSINATWDKNGKMTYHLNRDRSWDSGLLQINSCWHSRVKEVFGVDTGSKRKDMEVLLDVENNIRFAAWIMDNSSGKLANWRIYKN
jgi:hypothetical protein